MKLGTLVPALLIALVSSRACPGSEPAAPKCELDLSSARLDDALLEISRQCHLQVLYFSDITSGKAARKLHGEYAIDEALDELLESTGLAFRFVDATTVQVTRDTAARHPTADKQRTRRPPNELDFEEVVIRGSTKDLVATRTETPLRDIPQSISIISAEQMRQQGNLNFLDAAQDAVGVSSARMDSYFLQLFTRGFLISSYTLDGGAGLRVARQGEQVQALLLTPDLGGFDRIEILRGSNALFGADANPAGTINLIRKRPQRDPQIHLSSTAGSWENYRQEIDATGPLALGGALRGRIVVSNASRNYFYETAEDRRQSVFGVLDYDLTDNTVVALGGSYLKSRARPFEGGAPMSYDTIPSHTGPDLPTTPLYKFDPKLQRGKALAFDWARFDTRVAEGFFRMEHAFGGGESRLRFNATYLDNSASYFIGRIGAIEGWTRTGYASAQYTLEPFAQKHLSLESTLTGAGQWWGHRVEWALGADFLRTSSSTHTGAHEFGREIDPYNFDSSIPPSPIRNYRTMAGDVDIRMTGAIASLRAQITQPWSVTAGARVTTVRGSDTNAAMTPTSSRIAFQHNNVITPYLGTQFRLNSTWSLYASYADIFSHNGGKLRSNLSPLPPVRGITLEAGIKAAWREGALNGSLAIYKVTQRGLAMLQPVARRVANCCYAPSGRNKAEGVDLELSGQATQRWLIGGGYTFNQNEYDSLLGEPLVWDVEPTPRHLLKVWTDYRLPGDWDRWTIGGSLHAQTLVAPEAQLALQKAYAVVNPRVSYRFDEHWQAALTVNNVFDKHYYEDILGAAWYGEPRNYFLRVDARF